MMRMAESSVHPPSTAKSPATSHQARRKQSSGSRPITAPALRGTAVWCAASVVSDSISVDELPLKCGGRVSCSNSGMSRRAVH